MSAQKISQKTALRTILKLYLPHGFTMQAIVAMLFGGCLGAFFGGFVAASYSVPTFITVLSAVLGGIAGVGIVLGLGLARGQKG